MSCGPAVTLQNFREPLETTAMTRWILQKNLRLAVALFVGLAGLGATPIPTSVPYYGSIAHDRAYLREGPSYQHRVLWIYRRKDLPIQVIQTYDVWRKVRDSDGTVGWLHSTMVSDRRTVVVIANAPARIRNSDDPNAPVVALAVPGVVARLEACEADICEVVASGTDGWIKKQDVWGVGAGEVFRSGRW